MENRKGRGEGQGRAPFLAIGGAEDGTCEMQNGEEDGGGKMEGGDNRIRLMSCGQNEKGVWIFENEKFEGLIGIQRFAVLSIMAKAFSLLCCVWLVFFR